MPSVQGTRTIISAHTVSLDPNTSWQIQMYEVTCLWGPMRKRPGIHSKWKIPLATCQGISPSQQSHLLPEIAHEHPQRHVRFVICTHTVLGDLDDYKMTRPQWFPGDNPQVSFGSIGMRFWSNTSLVSLASLVIKPLAVCLWSFAQHCNWKSLIPWMSIGHRLCPRLRLEVLSLSERTSLSYMTLCK